MHYHTVYVVIFMNFVIQSSRKLPLQYMAIYSHENIKIITELSRREFSKLVQNYKNIWRIQYPELKPKYSFGKQ